MKIQLRRDEVDRALRKVGPGLAKYCWLQAELRQRDIANDAEFQRRFNGFYRVRRNHEWRQMFFRLLERSKAGPGSFDSTLRALQKKTGQC